MDLLVRNFNEDAVPGVMCTNTLNVSWCVHSSFCRGDTGANMNFLKTRDGSLYDCDFNQQLGMAMRKTPSVFDIDSVDDVSNQKILTDNHCFGCTAGMGSSCQGATV